MTRSTTILLLVLSICVACRQKESPPVAGVFREDALKIEVAETGFYRITAAMLAEAGWETTGLGAETISLQQGQGQVPYLISDGDLIFYGQAPDSRYTVARTYLLELNQGGWMMAETAVSPTNAPLLTQLPVTVHLEQNQHYEASALLTLPPAERDTRLVDLWFWQSLDLRQKQASIPVTLPAVADGSARLSLRLWGQSDNAQVADDHDLDIIINEQVIGTMRWDGKQFHVGQLDMPPGSLHSGENQLVLDNEVPGASFLDIMLLDWLKISYMAEPVAVNDRLQFDGVAGQAAITGFSERPFLFDTSDPDNPTILTGWAWAENIVQVGVSEAMRVTAVGPQGYLIPAQLQPVRASQWHTETQQADLLIITTDELAPALAPLVEARRTQGLTAVVVPLAEIYDAFGQGQAEPDSITAFVRYTSENWQAPNPRYLLLVGDATADYRDYLGQAPANLIPAPMVAVQFSGETVSDSRLTDVDGDKRPDLAVGRWPVSQVAEVEALVARTLAYETGTAVDRAVFATDASEGQFAAMAQRITDAADLTSAIFDGPHASQVAAEINEGTWLTTYIGHGSVGQWGKDDVFTVEAISQLDNATPPIVLQLTCLTGLFAHPQNTSLSEQMLRHEGGPVLIVAATSLTLSTHQEPFAAAFVQGLRDTESTRIGEAFQEAKRALDVNNNGLREISDTFVLLGDPSAMIVRPQ